MVSKFAAGRLAAFAACAAPGHESVVTRVGPEATSRLQFGEVRNPTTAALARIETVLADAGVDTAVIGVMRGGELVSETVYGERAPGEPATRHTPFDVASMAALDPQSPFRAQFERWRPEPEEAEDASE